MFRAILSLAFPNMGGSTSSMADISSADSTDNSLKTTDKDRVIMLTAEQDAQPVKSEHIRRLLDELNNDVDVGEGAVLPNGDINWCCPCMASLVAGPCGHEYRQAFSCFHRSTEQPKGIDCIDQFAAFSTCLRSYPNLYPRVVDTDNDDDNGLASDMDRETRNGATDINDKLTNS